MVLIFYLYLQIMHFHSVKLNLIEETYYLKQKATNIAYLRHSLYTSEKYWSILTDYDILSRMALEPLVAHAVKPLYHSTIETVVLSGGGRVSNTKTCI